MKRLTAVILLLALLLCGCGAPTDSKWVHTPAEEFCGLKRTGSLALDYAREFAVDEYEGGIRLISTAGGDQLLVLPPEAEVPDTELPVIRQPLENVYLVATSTMCLFDALDGLDAIALSGTKAENWAIENARTAMEEGRIQYAGKYSEPAYEQILAANCSLSIQSTMIHHTPEVREKLEELGIPVLVDYSSYEPHPLGRTEWLKLYAVLLGKEAQAKTLFDAQVRKMDAVTSQEPTGKTAAFFYISSTGGYAVVRRSGDYVAKMIALAGGKYVFDNIGDPDSAAATVKITMEEFYAAAKNADVIFYNSTIDGQLESLEDLLAMNSLLADFKAVAEGNVWCTNANLYQDMTGLGTVMEEMHRVFTDTADDRMEFLYRLN